MTEIRLLIDDSIDDVLTADIGEADITGLDGGSIILMTPDNTPVINTRINLKKLDEKTESETTKKAVSKKSVKEK